MSTISMGQRMQLKHDLITLKEHAADSEAGMIVMSRQFDRTPHTDAPLLTLLLRAMKTPETWQQPQGTELCSTCGEFVAFPDGFPSNPSRKGRGRGYVCNKCRAKEARMDYAYQASLEGRTVREYKQRNKAA